jgi:hypothetical protein
VSKKAVALLAFFVFFKSWRSKPLHTWRTPPFPPSLAQAFLVLLHRLPRRICETLYQIGPILCEHSSRGANENRSRIGLAVFRTKSAKVERRVLPSLPFQ